VSRALAPVNPSVTCAEGTGGAMYDLAFVAPAVAVAPTPITSQADALSPVTWGTDLRALLSHRRVPAHASLRTGT
jgi:hypothetical protein